MHLKIPPVVQLIIIALMMWLISKYTVMAFDFSGRPIIGRILLFLGALFGILGVYHFRQAKTTVNPTQPGDASNLVTNGIYKYTRNPMYLGMLLLLIGIFLKFGNYLNAAPIVLFVWYMTKFQIKPEEDALKIIFGEAFDAYCKKVRRWI